jgi:uncharacterized membrane protein (UPF0127 family)
MQTRIAKFASVAIAAACALSCASAATKNVVEFTLSGHKLKAELAATETERERGLMFRTALEDGNGMLFVFESDQRVSFWMKNTRLPLSVAYIAHDGTIKEIHDMEPFSLESVPSSSSVRYALEVPRGYFERIGIRPGYVIELPESVR